MARVLCDTAVRWVGDLPPFERDSKDIQAALHAVGMEIERIDAARDSLRNGFYPAIGTDYLALWEQELSLSVNPPDKTLAQRQQSVLGFLRKLRGEGSGLDWIDRMNALLGTGWSYLEHTPGSPSPPAANTLLVTLPYSTAIAAPAGLAGTAGGGGALAAGTYFYTVTSRNFYGETTQATPISKVVGASGSVALTWTAVTGATSYGVFRGTSSSNMVRIANPTVASYSDLGGAAIGAAPPAVNTTESYQAFEAKALARLVTPAHIDLTFGYGVGFILNVSRFGDAL